jgi:hypothetical protein
MCVNDGVTQGVQGIRAVTSILQETAHFENIHFIYIYIHTHTHTHIHIYIHTHGVSKKCIHISRDVIYVLLFRAELNYGSNV